eukprot:Tbor_TRINITY_DN6164_c1_g1::TRINITY_DN6164_c1_g1_i3::g.22600::m.22600
MRYLLIILVLLLLMAFYCISDMDQEDYVTEDVYDPTTAINCLKVIEAEFSRMHFHPRSTYDSSIVNWTLTCSMSPPFLSDLAYTLKQITDVLEEFEISYILEGGTLLGALRMNGPLPYDDDIDITVLEEDFVPK